jgi:hypothetical protein
MRCKETITDQQLELYCKYGEEIDDSCLEYW